MSQCTKSVVNKDNLIKVCLMIFFDYKNVIMYT